MLRLPRVVDPARFQFDTYDVFGRVLVDRDDMVTWLRVFATAMRSTNRVVDAETLAVLFELCARALQDKVPAGGV